MKNNQIEIHWAEAEQNQKNTRAEKEKTAVKYRKNVKKANREFLSRLGFERISLDDFYDSASMYGIEVDDLLNSLI
jgi:hypothetical protein